MFVKAPYSRRQPGDKPILGRKKQGFLEAIIRPRFFPRKTVRVVAGPPVDLSRWLGGPRTRTALDGATGAIMADITALVAGLRGEEPPAAPYDPAAAIKAAARTATGIAADVPVPTESTDPAAS